MTFTLVVAESDILPINIPVASLQFPYQRAFGYLFASQQPIRTDIVGECGKESDLSRTAGTSRRTSAGLSAKVRPPAASSWYVPNIFLPVATDVHTLHTDGDAQSASPQSISCTYRPLERWQPVDSCLPVRSFMVAVLCGHGTDHQKRTEDSHEYTHHRVRGLKFPMGTTVITPSSFTLRLLKSNSSS